jgi:ribosomal protein S18 acetylase RimI-like enzyme
MPQVDIRIFEPRDERQVVELWRACKMTIPANDPHKDIAIKLAWQPNLLFVAAIDAKIIGTVMVGYDGHRGWINYLAVASEHRRHGVGKALMDRAEMELKRIGCPKINLQVRTTNTQVIEFYKAIGFDVEERVSMGKRLTS